MRDRYGVGLWKAIRRLREIVNSGVFFSMGNDKRVKFWKDIWCGDKPLICFFSFLICHG